MIDEANYKIGYGLRVKLDNKLIRVGSIRFMTLENIIIPPTINTFQTTHVEQGASLVYIAVNFDLANSLEKKYAMQRGFIIVIIAGVMCVSGVYFFHMSIITAGVLYNMTLGASVVNAMLAKLKSKSISKN